MVHVPESISAKVDRPANAEREDNFGIPIYRLRLGRTLRFRINASVSYQK
jgi:hypothetical protein